MFVQKGFPLESFCTCAVSLQTHGHTLLPPEPCSHPLLLQTPPHLCSPLFKSTHPSSSALQPCSLRGREQRGQLGRGVSKSGSGQVRSGGSSVHSLPHPSVQALLCSGRLLLHFFSPMCALLPSSPFPLSSLCLPSVCPEYLISPCHPQSVQLQPTSFAVFPIIPLAPALLPSAPSPHLLLPSRTMPAFLPTSRREQTSYQLPLRGHLSVGCQQPKPSCSCISPHHCTAGQPLRPSTLTLQRFSWVNFQSNK